MKQTALIKVDSKLRDRLMFLKKAHNEKSLNNVILKLLDRG